MVALEFENDALFRDFLGEIQALEDFRAEYGRRYSFEGLERDDQDVRRLIEAMAYYSARSRGSAERAMRQLQRQALEQLFPYLLTPMPAMGMVCPELHPNMNEVRFVPQGATFVATEYGGDGAALCTRTFRSMAACGIYPLHIVKGSVSLENMARQRGASARGSRQQGWSLKLQVAADARGSRFQRYYDHGDRPLRQLTLHVNPAGDTLLALRLFDALQSCLQRFTVRIRSGADERYIREHRVSGANTAGRGGASWHNPVESVRRLIHFPLAELAVEVPLPGVPAEWDLLELELHLSEAWPNGLSVVDSSFLLNAIAVENLSRGLAEVIEHDGASARLRIEHAEPVTGMRVREVLGVFLGDPGDSGAHEALMPSSLVDGGYRIDIDGLGAHRTAWLCVDDDLGELERPRTLHVDADWYDPDGVLPNPSTTNVTLEEYDVGPVTWTLVEPLSGPKDSPVLGNARGLQRLLDLHGKDTFTVNDLRSLFHALGTNESEIFGRIPRYIQRLDVKTTVDSQSPRGAILVYEVSFSAVPPLIVPAVRLLLRELPHLLAIWTGVFDVRVTVLFDAQPELDSLHFEWRSP